MEKTDNRFSKIERLTSKTIIQEIFDNGTVFYIHPFKVFYMLNEASQNRILITVPKRLHKKAVDRNLIKRRVRESYRVNKAIISINPHLDITLVYTSSEILDFKQINKKISDVLAKIKKSVTVAGKNIIGDCSVSFPDAD
jgi:ribonuclease P protein component